MTEAIADPVPEPGEAYDPELDIAVIAMEGRFPGATDVEALWEALLEGQDLTSEIPASEGTGNADPDQVLREAVVEGIDRFDAAHFGIPAAQAALIDPQQRVFVELCRHALDSAGYDPRRWTGRIGVYAASGQGDYLMRQVLPTLRDGPESVEMFSAAISNLVSSLPTRVAYLLGLTGPALAVQTACSSSLVAVHTACQDLLTLRSDLALAGGVTLNPTPGRGYRYEPGGLLSPDGRCRPFDADAAGMAGGDGAAVVVLKRLSDALRDGDRIRAVISGSAVNNDGNRKVGFTAPSVEGQAEVIADALASAGVDASDIGYVEAHGTGTPVGDPIEIASLKRVFGSSPREHPCLVGSVKSNLGHTDTAAGVIGLIKAVLCVERATIPATIHFRTPNPALGLDSSPFRIADTTSGWTHPGVRRAGVSAFGIGGTNAHVIVTEPPAVAAPSGPDEPSVVVLSATSPGALDRAVSDLADHVRRSAPAPDRPRLADVAFTLQTGRPEHPHRWALAAADLDDLAARLVAGAGETGSAASGSRPVVWLFPGGGVHYPGLAADLRRLYPVFDDTIGRAVRHCATAGIDLEAVLGGVDAADPTAATGAGFCAVIAVESALASLMMSWGMTPCAVLGHSLGEYSAAVTAGVMSLEDALTAVIARGALLTRAGGSSVVVAADAASLTDVLTAHPDIDLAAVNSPESCLFSGPTDAISALTDHLDAVGVPVRALRVSTAVHSRLLDPVLDEYRDVLRRLDFHPPTIPLVGAAHAVVLDDATATTTDYWVDQTRRPVQFAESVRLVAKEFGDPLLLEVGPGRGLTTAARTIGADATHTMRTFDDTRHDAEILAAALGHIWVHGGDVDLLAVHRDRERRREPLPVYPFERARHWITPSTTRLGGDPPLGHLVPDGLGAGFETARALARPGRHLLLGHPSTVLAAAPPAPAPAELAVADTGTPNPPAPDSLGTALLDRFAALSVLRAFGSAGIGVAPGDILCTPELLRSLTVQRPYDRLVAELVDLLIASGLATGSTDRCVLGNDAGNDPRALRQRVLDERPDLAAELDSITHCANHLVAVVGGRESGVEAMFASEAFAVHQAAEDARADALLAPSRDAVVQAMVRIADAAEGRPLRILELGAGRGFVTWPIAEALRGREGIEYVVTDIGRSLVLDAREEAGRRGLDFLRFDVLDAGLHPAAQGFDPGSVDVVVAFNVLHAVENLPVAVDHAVSLLAPGGTALVLELARLPRHGILTAGLFEGMWHHTDALRDRLPIVAPEVWESELVRAGCTPTTVAHPDGVGGTHALIVGRRGAEPAEQRLATLRATGALVECITAPAVSVPLTLTETTALTESAAVTEPPAFPTAPADSPGSGSTSRSERSRLDGRPALTTPYREPSGKVEELVATRWAEALGLDRVGVDDDFFELGGESLLAMRILNALRRDFSVEMPARTIFDRPTVSAVAVFVEQLDRSRPSATTDASPLRRRGRTAVLDGDGSLITTEETLP